MTRVICEICGELFTLRNSRRPARTCSRSCTNKLVWREVPVRAKRQPDPRVIADCAWCGKPVKWAQRPSRQGRYCSKTCAGRARTKGGIAYKTDGRWYVRTRDGGWQLYSRCLMEAHLGQHLTYNEVVHHLNGDKTDDRIENLAVMSRSDHTRMHATEYWSILRAHGRS